MKKWNFTKIGENFDELLPRSPSEPNSPEQSSGLQQIGFGRKRENGSKTIERTDDDASGDASTDEDEALPAFELISSRKSKFEKFSKYDYVTEFRMNPTIRLPDDKLEQFFDQQIQIAIRETEHEGRKVEMYGVHLFGHGLDSPIRLNVRPIEQNSAEILMNEIYKLGHSEGENGIDKRTILLSHPMKLLVTCVAPPRGEGSKYSRQFFGYEEKQIMRVGNLDNKFCLFYALCLAQKRCDHHLHCRNVKLAQSLMPKQTFSRFAKDEQAQKKEALNLMKRANISFEERSYGVKHLEMIQKYWVSLAMHLRHNFMIYPNLYRIVAFENAPELEVRPIWKADPGGAYIVAVFLDNRHWHAIRNICSFFRFGKNTKFCIDCESTYQCDQKHSFGCEGRCYHCSKVGTGSCPPEDGLIIECTNCFRSFFNRDCWERHKALTCKMWKKCTKECGRVYLYNQKVPHDCLSSFCKRCSVYHPISRGCFIKPKKIQKKVYRIAAFDIETSQDKNVYDGHNILQLHQPNYVSLRITCTQCADNGPTDSCEICGPKQLLDWSEPEGVEDPIGAFTEWLITAFDNKYETLIWSHNGGRFDSHFVFEYLCKTNRRPDPVMQGLKIYEFKIQNSPKHSKCIFRDSYLLWSIPLSQLPSTFNLSCADKPFFPYLFNKKSNYDFDLKCLPDQQYYCPESMSKEKHAAFIKWYNENKDIKPFCLRKELREYTRNDTEILMQALLAFRKIFMRNITNGADVLYSNTTLAGICMQVFKSMFLKENEIALVPERGFERADKSSVLAIKYCEYRAKRDGLNVQHAGNGAEIRHNGKKLDCFVPEKNLAIEVFGCYYHGCLKCYKNGDKLVNDRCAKELNDETWRRIQILHKPDKKRGILNVETVWEHEIYEQLKIDPQMKEFFDDLGNEKGPIDPRAAYAGGRTGPTCLYAKACKRKKISIFDVVSLYPYCQFTTAYPVGIPKIIRPHASETNVLWKNPSDIPYQGLLKVRLIPPRNLRISVLPIKIGPQLVFCTCFRCAQKFQKTQNRVNDYKCPHTNKERAFVSTVTHIELAEALRQNYVVDRFYRAWHFQKFSDNIFKDYVRLFLRLKVEASGFPPSVRTDEQKRAFVQLYKDKYGVNIQLEKVAWNPGLRYIAKVSLRNTANIIFLFSICLNSLWGKFSMRNKLGKNLVTKNPSEFYKLVFDHRIEMQQIIQMSESTLRVNYSEKNDFVNEHSSSNILISLWTTSAARLVLLKFMNQIENIKGAKLLYTDTDSCIVLHDREITPLDTGDFLGEMQEEFTSYEIQEFCSGGPKQWGISMREKNSGMLKHLLKIRGITMDMQNCKKFHFADFKHMVQNYGRNRPFYFRYRKFGPGKTSRITTRDFHKKYLPVLQKGIVTKDLDVLPFGFNI